MVFKNEAQLKKFLIEKCSNAVSNARDEIFNEFNFSMLQFYSEYDPVEYIRTSALKNSLKSSGVTSTRSGAYAEVYFDTPSYDTGTWDGETVLEVALTTSVPHGGLPVGGTPIWNETMRVLGDKQGIENLLKQELRNQGLNLK